VLIVGGNQSAAGSYEVANSCRFNDGSSDYLQWNSSPAGNRQKFTFSVWLKRTSLGTSMIASSSFSSSDEGYFFFDSNDKLTWQTSTTGMGDLKTKRVFKDLSAWMHIVLSVDTTQSTSTSRMRLYINGSEYTWDENTTQPDQNKEIYWNVGGTYYPYIGRRSDGNYFDGYMAEIVHIDDQQLDATSFGEFDEDTGIWKPTDVSGLTFGGNTSYYLDFEDSSSLGNDVSGNNNDFTANNLTSIDQSTDTCTNNAPTFNPNFLSDGTTAFSEGNLKLVSSGTNGGGLSTIGVSSGKWYIEVKQTGANEPLGNGEMLICVVGDPAATKGTIDNYEGRAFAYGIRNHNGTKFENTSGSTSWHGNWGAGDIISIALDMDSNNVYFAKNGQYANGSGSWNQAFTGSPAAISLSTDKTFYFIGVGHAHSSATGTFELNAVSPSFTISSGNSDENGYGNFEYSVPSGYYALNTKNLAEYG